MVGLADRVSAMQQCCPGMHGGTAQAAGLIIEGPGGTASWCLQHLCWQGLSNLINCLRTEDAATAPGSARLELHGMNRLCLSEKLTFSF